MRTYQLMALAIGASGSVSITIPQKGILCGISWDIRTTTAPAGNDVLGCSLQLNQATDQGLINDGIGVIDTMSLSIGAITAASGMQTAVNKWSGPMAIPLNPIDRFYLHYLEGGGGTYNIRCVLHVK